MAILKTYLLAPNFTTHLGANVQLGSIIANPFRPNKWIGEIPLHIETDTHVEYDRSISPGMSASTHVNIFAKFLETASGTIGLQKEKNILDHYTMDTLETISYKRDITDDEAAEMVRANSKLQEVMKSGILGSVPVYIVTGLKVAKGFHLTSEITKSKGANIDANIPVTNQVSAGADLSVSQTKTLSEQSSTAQDIVFAYQLHAVANRGYWKKRRVDIDIYAPKAAALGKDNRTTEDAVAVVGATTEDIEEAQFDYGDVAVTEHHAYEGERDSLCICITFKDQA
ncbi:unnamed protein product [Aureobasidium vineae]|uniref:Uncharacterized protein n=1 Tax=Aureobasidium vineae TaxID=2773715 RepID=A0A9N8JC44_9PEZI|nr:unnamed protein product [Aureobasidium vineae]